MRALRTHERGGLARLVDEEAPLDWPAMWVMLAHEVSGVVPALGWAPTGVSVGDAVHGLKARLS